MDSRVPYHLQSSSSQIAPPKSHNAELNKTMAYTVEDFAKTLPTPKVLTWSERRALYTPNTDAASLGFGSKHRDYQRYMSPWQGAHEKEQQTLEYSTSGTDISVNENDCESQIHTPFTLHTDAHVASKSRDPKTLAHAAKLNLLTNPALKNKPTTYDNRGRVIKDAQGLGYGHKHPTHYTYTAAKQPRDVIPVTTKLNLNSWL